MRNIPTVKRSTFNKITYLKWPSPEWFHVPLVAEWSWLKTIMDWLSLTTWDSWRINLHMPFSGGRNFKDASILGQGDSCTYWTCVSYYAEAYYFDLKPSDISFGLTYCAYWYPIRCFKNSYATPDSSWTVIQWSLWSAWIFWNQSEWLISITDGNKWYTIMDKNLWATVVYNDWDTLTQANMWNMYQWWNNYWFKSTWTISKKSSTRVDASWYWPSNPYSSDTFIAWNNNWTRINNEDLWWYVSYTNS